MSCPRNAVTMISIEQAFQLILEQAAPVAPLELSLAAALGRTLAVDAVSDIDSPPYDKSLMDGYALRAQDVQGTELSLPVSDNIPAGSVPRGPLAIGTAARIMTGAPLPAGADTVVVVEETVTDGDPPRVRILRSSVEPDQNLLRQGSCLYRGQVILPRGTRLGGAQLGLLAETGNDPVAVNNDIRVAIVATGNELVEAGQSPGPGQIRNSNGPLLGGLVTAAGATALDLGIAQDDMTALREKIEAGLQADILLLSGGVSAGDLDLVPQVLRGCRVREIFHQVSIKPGKPLWFGRGERTLVFGLPGNPVSSHVCFQIFVRPTIARLMGQKVADHHFAFQTALLAGGHQPRGGRTTYFPARFRREDSRQIVELLPWKGSADLYTLAIAEGLVELPAGIPIADLGEVRVLDLR